MVPKLAKRIFLLPDVSTLEHSINKSISPERARPQSFHALKMLHAIRVKVAKSDACPLLREADVPTADERSDIGLNSAELG